MGREQSLHISSEVFRLAKTKTLTIGDKIRITGKSGKNSDGCKLRIKLNFTAGVSFGVPGKSLEEQRPMNTSKGGKPVGGRCSNPGRFRDIVRVLMSLIVYGPENKIDENGQEERA